MGDPELTARAQRAADRLERAWDRWRRLNGLTAEQAQPVSSYVGYSLAEPWGRPRVVFGVGAEEAERLADLIEQDAATDPRYSQGQLWEPEPQPMEYTSNGAHAAEPAGPDGGQRAPQAGAGAAAQWVPGVPSFQPAPPAVNGFQAAPVADAAQVADRGVPQGFSADLAGWTASELPGQASPGLAARHAGPPGDAERAPGQPGPMVPSQQEPPPRSAEANTSPPDSAAWLRLA